MALKLTDAKIRNLPHPTAGRKDYADTLQEGLRVRVSASGHSSFRLESWRNGRHQVLVLGSTDLISITEARQKAVEALRKLDKGQGLATQKALSRATAEAASAATFDAIAARFMKEYAEGKKRPLRPSTVRGYRWALQGEPTKAWAHLPIHAITAREVTGIVSGLEAQGKFASARLFKAYAGKFFSWAVTKHYIETNPVDRVGLASTPGDFVRERKLSTKELQQLLKAADHLGPVHRAFIYTLALCGQRRHETAMMRWELLRLEGDQPAWDILAEVTKNKRGHSVPLSKEVIELLGALPRSGAFVFTTDDQHPISGFSKVKAKLDELLGDDFEAWRLHDLRRSCATGMADMGVAPHTIEAVLNHISGAKAGVAGVYNRGTYDIERRKALQAWAARLFEAEDGSNIIQFRV